MAERTKYYQVDRRGKCVQVEEERPIKWPDAYKQIGLDIDPAFLTNAGAGIVSTVLDLAKFDIALDQNRLISKSTKKRMYTPALSKKGKPMPYGLGWFIQDCKGTKLIWHFGFTGIYSSLILKIPKEEMTLILLANSGGVSRGFKLGSGSDPENIFKSPFAATFIKLFTRLKAN